MKKKIIFLTCIYVICLLLLLPSSQAIEKHLIEKIYHEKTVSNFDNLFSLIYFIKKIISFLELSIVIGISIFITQILSFYLLTFILEIGFGHLIYLLSMTLLLTIPIRLLNGVCLLLQKQLSLGKFETFILTFFSFLVYFIGNIIVKTRIPFNQNILNILKGI